MKHFFWRIAAVVLALGVYVSSVAWASGLGQDVRIGIREGRSSVTLTSPAGLAIWSQGKLWKKFPAQTPVQFSIAGNAIQVAGKKVGDVEVRPLSSAGFVRITDGYAYRGSLEIMKSPQRWGLTVVNVVPMEEYLYGVVGKEMSPSWHPEALKAQAVAARTYAVTHKNYFSRRGFDMTDDTASQTYAGINGEAPAVIHAVDATRGEIVTYRGKPIDAFFMSNAGGWTENSENVWGNKTPYLRGVADDSSHMPSYSWAVTTTPEKLGANLAAAGKGVGKVYSITLSPLARRPMAVPDRGVSGRVLDMIVRGSKGTVKVSGQAFQSIFGLKSTLFDFYQGKGSAPDPDSGKTAHGATLQLKAGEPLTIFGYGWGHGLGMSQYGAYQMAREHGSERNYYRKILTHYYTGTDIEKLY